MLKFAIKFMIILLEINLIWIPLLIEANKRIYFIIFVYVNNLVKFQVSYFPTRPLGRSLTGLNSELSFS